MRLYDGPRQPESKKDAEHRTTNNRILVIRTPKYGTVGIGRSSNTTRGGLIVQFY